MSTYYEKGFRETLVKLGATYYHGTRPSLIPKILEEGLDPEYSREGKEGIVSEHIRDWKPYISLTTDPSYAKWYARAGNMEDGSFLRRLKLLLRNKPEMLQVDLPEDYEVERVVGRAPIIGSDEYRVYETIDPQYLQKISSTDEKLHSWIEAKETELQEAIRQKMNLLAGDRHPMTLGRKHKPMIEKLLRAGGADPKEFVYNPEHEKIGPVYIPGGPLHRTIYRNPDDPRYVPKGKRGLGINPGRHPLTYAHEVGHATREGWPSELLHQSSILARTPLGTLPPIILGGLGGVKGKLRYPVIGAGLAALGAGLNVGEEMRATARGRKLLEQLGHTPSEEEEWAVRKALGTYMTQGAVQTALPFLFYRLGK